MFEREVGAIEKVNVREEDDVRKQRRERERERKREMEEMLLTLLEHI